jgi:hypothetical protein
VNGVEKLIFILQAKKFACQFPTKLVGIGLEGLSLAQSSETFPMCKTLKHSPLINSIGRFL